MKKKKNKDVEKTYTKEQFIAKLRRFADALEKDEGFQIQIDGERLYVPAGAKFNVEHEREDGKQEIEFQIKWDVK
jgi:amphi-Trp domain-containing protein